MEKRNQKNKERGNGEGTIYYSETLEKWVAQYFEPNGKRKTITQRKNESVREFKDRFKNIMHDIKNDDYISKNDDSIVSILTQFIKQKNIDGDTSPRGYSRDKDTLNELIMTCSEFCYLPIQKVTIKHIEDAKENIKKYSKRTIDKIWQQLNMSFKIACSPTRKIIKNNIMLDITLKRPRSEKKTKKVKPITEDEFQKLLSLLNNELKKHKYANIVKMQMFSGMRIGEVLARSINDLDKEQKTFDVHNTVTQDENYKVILGEHTKTYNKETGIDEGQRLLPLDVPLFNDLNNLIKEEVGKKTINIHKMFFWSEKRNWFINPSSINSWLERINQKYKICKGRLTTHRIRHAVATRWYYKYGIPLPVIQYLLGHIEGSSVTEAVYIDTSYENVRDVLLKSS